MKKQYIAPSMFSVNLLGTSIIAASGGVYDNPDGSPAASTSNITGNDDAWNNAAAKENNTWDDEW